MSTPAEYMMFQQRRRDEQLQNLFNMALQAYQIKTKQAEQGTQNAFEERRTAAYEKSLEPRPMQPRPQRPLADILAETEGKEQIRAKYRPAKATPTIKPTPSPYLKTVGNILKRLQTSSNRLKGEYSQLRGNFMTGASPSAKSRLAELEPILQKIANHEAAVYELETKIQGGYKPTPKELEYLYTVSREMPMWGIPITK